MDKDLLIKKAIEESIETKSKLLLDDEILCTIKNIADEVTKSFKDDKKLLICGNGGSAADAQHIAAEFSGRYYLDRKPLHAEALHSNSSFLTAVANDYSYDEVYSRMVEGAGRQGDVLIGISTSGNSKNVIKAIEKANEKKMITVGFVGSNGGAMNNICKYIIKIPSKDTPRIQESHILVGHIVAEIVEKELFAS